MYMSNVKIKIFLSLYVNHLGQNNFLVLICALTVNVIVLKIWLLGDDFHVVCLYLPLCLSSWRTVSPSILQLSNGNSLTTMADGRIWTDRTTREKLQSPASSKGGILIRYMRKQVAHEHTWTPHHDTTLSLSERRHEPASLTLNIILWHEKNILL